MFVNSNCSLTGFVRSMSVRGAKVASGLGGVTMRRMTVSFCGEREREREQEKGRER